MRSNFAPSRDPDVHAGTARPVFGAGALAEADLRRVFEYEIDRARRYKRPLSLIRAVPGRPLADNARLAHAGDAPKVVRSAVRRIDHVGVLNDRSIVALLPETEERAANAAALRVASALRSVSRSSQIGTWRVGVATLTDGYQTIESMLLQALAEALQCSDSRR